MKNLPLNASQNDKRTMSSVEIAELTGKRHKNVIRDVEVMFSGLEEDPSNYLGAYVDSSNRPQPCFNLPRMETEILITGYDVKRRAAVIRRWHALESGSVSPSGNLPANIATQLTAMVSMVERQEEQLAKLTEQNAENAKQNAEAARMQRTATVKTTDEVLKAVDHVERMVRPKRTMIRCMGMSFDDFMRDLSNVLYDNPMTMDQLVNRFRPTKSEVDRMEIIANLHEAYSLGYISPIGGGKCSFKWNEV